MKFFQLGQYPVFDDFLDDQGHGYNQVGTHFRENFPDYFRGGGAGNEINMGATGKRIEQFESQSVHVGHGEYGHQPFAGSISHLVQGIFQVRPQAAVG